MNHRTIAQALRAGGPEVIEVNREDLAPLQKGEVLVRVKAAGLNHVDSLVRSGSYSFQFPFPYGVGVEGAGVIEDVGANVSLQAGYRVCWTGVFGSCANYVIANADMLTALPDELSFEVGASLAHAGLTAGGLARHWPLQKGSYAVVWGAAGAVGRLLVAFLAEHGVHVIGIASGHRVDVVLASGAVHAIDRTSRDVKQAVLAFTNQQKVAAVFDPVGAETFQTNLELIAPRGCLINYGQLSGSLPTIDLKQLMMTGSIFVTKYGPGGVSGATEMRTMIGAALSLASSRPVLIGSSRRFPLTRTADAYRAMDSGVTDKVLVLPDEPVH
ncbi:alcohol dehydrogenase [Brevibacillus choshinensis]|uniref:Alcohol dehydrogenase n=2 Tax=Brevibacillus choshinensis TaxID=54911 RepID=A0ABR5N401_BRECH|nr:alcohol dehydrogenase [Brevibacillus choshinensis]